MLVNSIIRPFHVSNRWAIFCTPVGSTFFSFFSLSFIATGIPSSVSCTSSVRCIFSLSVRLLSGALPKARIEPIPSPTNKTQTDTSNPNCFKGTRPIIIIRKTTNDSIAAVERFSGAIGSIRNAPVMSTYFIAFGAAPSAVCMALSICAVARIIAPLAISDGCIGMNPIFSHRAASFSFVPQTNTRINITKATGTRIGVASLKNLHLMLSVITITPTPINSRNE